MGLELFVKRFRNVNKIKFIDGWKFINKYPFEGGCGDFALTALVLIEGSWLKALWSILIFRSVFWLVNSPSNRWWWPRHVVLWHRKFGWIDSTNRKWRATATPHTKVLPLPFFWAYFRILWGFIWQLFTSK